MHSKVLPHVGTASEHRTRFVDGPSTDSCTPVVIGNWQRSRIALYKFQLRLKSDFTRTKREDSPEGREECEPVDFGTEGSPPYAALFAGGTTPRGTTIDTSARGTIQQIFRISALSLNTNNLHNTGRTGRILTRICCFTSDLPSSMTRSSFGFASGRRKVREDSLKKRETLRYFDYLARWKYK